MQLSEDVLPSQETNAVFSAFVIVVMLLLCMWLLRVVDAVGSEAAQRERLESVVASYKRMAEESGHIRKLRHDMRHHFQAAASYIEQGQPEKRESTSLASTTKRKAHPTPGAMPQTIF